MGERIPVRSDRLGYGGLGSVGLRRGGLPLSGCPGGHIRGLTPPCRFANTWTMVLSLARRCFRGPLGLAVLTLAIQMPVLAQILAPGVSLVDVSPAYGLLQGGSFSRHGLVSVGTTQYVAFYGVNTNITVGRRTLGTTNWTLSATSFRPNNATDGHDIISIGLSGDNYLHCSWGMHADAFNYARGIAPGSLILVKTNMTGAENRVTYPQFISMPDGDLLSQPSHSGQNTL